MIHHKPFQAMRKYEWYKKSADTTRENGRVMYSENDLNPQSPEYLGVIVGSRSVADPEEAFRKSFIEI